VTKLVIASRFEGLSRQAGGMKLLGISGLVLVSVVCSQAPAQAPFAPIDWKRVDQALGKAGSVQPDGAYKFGLPRGDLHVSVSGVTVKPALALGSWVALEQVSDSEAVLMGDLVLLEGEVGPVPRQTPRRRDRADGAAQSPVTRVPGRPVHAHRRARGAGEARLCHPRRSRPYRYAVRHDRGATPSAPLGIDTAQVGQILGYHGKVNGGVYQVGVPRAEAVTVDGVDIPPSMGLATAINFQPIGRARAATTGDFALLGAEVKPGHPGVAGSRNRGHRPAQPHAR
jgi:hypothetical protein